MADREFTKKSMSKIRFRLMMQQPFWGSLAMLLKVVEDESLPTIATDGNRLIYNPAFMAGLTQNEQLAVVAHEIEHCAMLHMFRRGDRDWKDWNKACDFAINPLLVEAGFDLPMHWKDPRTGRECKPLLDPRFAGMGAERIYAILRQEKQEQKLQGNSKGGKGKNGKDQTDADAGEGDGDEPSPTGTFSDAPQNGSGTEDAAAAGMTERDWQLAAEQAAVQASKAGKLPGSHLDMIRATSEAKIDWSAHLNQFVVQNTVSDVAWRRPNRRYVGRGMFLPGVVRENVGKIVVGLDSSGSMSVDDLTDGAAEMTGILRSVRPEEIIVVSCDTKVHGIQVFTPDDQDVLLEAKGRGGTALQPVFDWVRDNDIDPVCLVYFTDLESSDTPKDPGYPVLWVTPEHSSLQGAFGDTISIPAH